MGNIVNEGSSYIEQADHRRQGAAAFAFPEIAASLRGSRQPTGDSMPAPARTFPPFSLTRLLRTVFAPKGGERVAILIDLPEP